MGRALRQLAIELSSVLRPPRSRLCAVPALDGARIELAPEIGRALWPLIGLLPQASEYERLELG